MREPTAMQGFRFGALGRNRVIIVGVMGAIMPDRQGAPNSLKIVAFMFFLGGIGSVIEIILAAAHGRIYLNFGVLGLFIGRGLLAFRPGWRTCALVFTWIGLVLIPVIGLILLSLPGPLDFTVFGEKIGKASKAIGMVFTVLAFSFEFWQLHVLTRPDVCRLFMLTRANEEPPLLD
jgi:hypothetical protein